MTNSDVAICEYRGYQVSLRSTDAQHTALVHKSGNLVGYACVSRRIGLWLALRKACDVIDNAHRESAHRPAQGTTA